MYGAKAKGFSCWLRMGAVCNGTAPRSLTAQQVVGSLEAQGNDRPKIRASETSLVSSFWTMPAGPASGTATARARLTKKATVANENCIFASFMSFV